MNETPGRTYAAASPSGGDIAYRTQSLKYTNIENAFDESVSFTAVLHLFLRAFLVTLMVGSVLAFFGINAIISQMANDPFRIFSIGNSLIFFNVACSLVFWIALLASQLDEPISEWKALLEDKADASTSAYAAMYSKLQDRQFPVVVMPQRIRSDFLAPKDINERLVMTDGNYTAFVSVFPFGTSLYVGWTMWRRRRGAVLVGRFAKDLTAGIFGESSSVVNQMLRTERARAMREAIHAAVREGVDVAVANIDVPLASTFGAELPVIDLRDSGKTITGDPSSNPRF